MSYWYLASPYMHADEAIREARFQAALAATAALMNKGEIVFSPIAHSHPIAVNHSLPLDWAFWEKFDRAFVEQSKGIMVLMIDGWRESKGVTAELAYARELGLPVRFYKLKDEGGIDELI